MTYSSKQTLSVNTAKYAPGMTVRHRKLGYIGLIFDVDAVYSQSDEWYSMMATSAPRKDKPWYHIMVDGENHTTYVSEEHLMAADSDYYIEHPLFSSIFTRHGGDIEMRVAVN